MTGEGAGRIPLFDAFRAVNVFIVVSLHAAMTYMPYVPPWWYVIDDQKGLPFLIWVLLTDTFPMPALFFLSGYFAPASLLKRGRGAFLRDKALRIGLPWIAGVLLFAPLFARASWQSLDLPLPERYGAFLTTIWLGPGYQQAHFWFLGVLLALFVLYSLSGPASGGYRRVTVMPTTALAFWWLTATAAFFLVSLRWEPNLWIPLGPLFFQPARIISYLGAFWLGVCAWQDRWLQRPIGKRDLILSGLMALGCALALLAVTLSFPPGGGALAKFLQAAAHNGAALALGLLLFHLCHRFLPTGPSTLWRRLGEASYGIYWLHQMIAMPLAAFLLPVDLPSGVKFALVLVGGWGISALLTEFVLRRFPLLKKIF
jgi:peptidoglycan/LPS O-acetylase OafA/YrhL